MPKIIRITTVPMALHVLLKGQMRYMQQKGMEVIMVSADGKEREAVISDEGVPHIIVNMTRKITPLKDTVALWQLVKLFKKHKPDIIHSHTPKAGLLAMTAGKIAGVKVRVHTIAGLRFFTTSGITRRVLMAMEKITGRNATHVWVNSHSLLEYIKANKLIQNKKLEVLGKGSSNGINLNRYSAKSLEFDRLSAIKKHISFSDKYTYLLCVGRIVRDKGIRELIEAFVRIYKQNSHLRLLLVGEFEDSLDPVGEEVKKQLRDHPGIIMAGWSEEVEYYMHLSSLLIHPSHREGFPNVLLQAGALKCPVICSGIPGNIDIVENHKTGLIFEVNNPEDLYKQVTWALDHSNDMGVYAENLLKKIENFYDQKILHETIYQRYMEILE